ncbi:MAG TPA: FxsA family protein [Acidimicrobiia bacterium]|nr:FxsA family protein [Acidimicrobiia bacterium]
MFAFFVALAIVVGVVEITVMIQVGQWIGFLNTMGLLLLVSLAGAWLVKRQGLGVMARIREQRMAGRLPAADLFDGALILLAGVLLVIPGFVTDAIALLLLLPPVRHVVRRFVSRRVLREVELVRSKQWTRGAPPSRQYVPPESPRRPPPPPTPLPPASPPDR